MKELEYPFDSNEILKRKKSYRKKLLSDMNAQFIEVRIAILGGYTTRDIKLTLELFLLDQGIRPVFYESEYNQFYEDGMFDNPELKSFAPEVIYICTSIRNLTHCPEMTDDTTQIEEKLDACYQKFEKLWDHLASVYHCQVIQNNFEYPFYRLLGNRDAWDIHGTTNFVTRLNCRFYQYAQLHEKFYICDINYISASYGLDKWSDTFYYHMYKYAVASPAIPYLAFNVSNIIKSLYGKNKKAFNLDLDNTLWGGIIGDEGFENIEIGQETSLAQTYSEFQMYIKKHKQIGVLLTVNSKNNEDTALSGLQRPDSILHPDDFVSIKANWNPKSRNLMETAQELSLLPESFVFVDDNPAEREIIRQQYSSVQTPSVDKVENYIRTLDHSGFFEVTQFSEVDLHRNAMYQDNAKRRQLELSFENYEDYLIGLKMKGEIAPFTPMYISRIAQLTNKSNQFNLTTRRYSQTEIEEAAADANRITLYGKLTDKFGDNGVVSVVIGRIDGKNKDELHMELWLMSCRVLKRDMEYAMMDSLVLKAQASGIRRIIGYYFPTSKNAMVKDFYEKMGFVKIREDELGNTEWEYMISDHYQNKQCVIDIS